MKPAKFTEEFVHLDLMLLIFQIQMIKYFFFLCFSNVGIIILSFKPCLPHFNLGFFLLDQSDQCLILINEMGVLGEKNFYLLLKIINFLNSSALEHDLFIEGQNFSFECFSSVSPILIRVGAKLRISVSGRASRIEANALVIHPALIGGLSIVSIIDFSNGATSHYSLNIIQFKAISYTYIQKLNKAEHGFHNGY